MKRNKFSILSVIALGGVMACGPMASAQDNSTATPPPPAQAPGDAGARPPRGGPMQGSLANLNLTPEQKEKAAAVIKDQRDKMVALRGDSSLTPEDRRAKMKEIMDGTNAKMKTILTDEQYTKWQSSRRPMMRPGRPAGGTNAAPGGATAPVKPDAPQN